MGDMTQTGTITVTQATKILGESRWTVVRRIKAGELLAEKLEGHTSPWLLSRADVERFAARDILKRSTEAVA